LTKPSFTSTIILKDYIGMVHTTESGTTATYYFQRNLLGDVIGIYDTNGTKVGGYAYDAWGNCTITLNTNGIATRNPIRYRGYYYDQDTKLYYLNARYYCPDWRRFISPDDTGCLDPENVNGLNLYAYCYNNPVNYTDSSGHMPDWTKWLIGGLVIAGLAIATIATGGAAGGVAGFILAGALKGAVIGAVSGALVSGVISGISSAIAGDGFWDGFTTGAASGFMSGAIIGGITGAITNTVQVLNAAKMWQPGTSPRTSTPFKTMKHHYKHHVIDEGFKKGNNIVKYTRDAVRFMNRNAASLKYQVPHSTGLQPFWTIIDKVGMNGQFTSAGKILTFWYIAL
jgi:RHS repeat-associated protein